MIKRQLIATLMAGLASTATAHDHSQLDAVTAFFSEASIVSGPELIDCTLAGGTQTECFTITVKPDPQEYTPGPWCPTHVDDTAEEGGIWFVNDEAVDVDGAFIRQLADIYGDTNWQLFDPETGDVRFTGTLEACEAAARPNVDPAYQNHCVECLPEYMPDDAAMTYVIPLNPVKADTPSPTNQAGSGLAYNGVRLDGPAPVDAILGAYTVAPFDDCGGHVNTHVGYHYHAVTDCLDTPPATTTSLTDFGPQIGIAMDGYPIFSHLLPDGSAPQGLDACGGHEVDGVYVYHAGAPGSNAILGCLIGVPGCASENGMCDPSQTRRGPPPRRD